MLPFCGNIGPLSAASYIAISVAIKDHFPQLPIAISVASSVSPTRRRGMAAVKAPNTEAGKGTREGRRKRRMEEAAGQGERSRGRKRRQEQAAGQAAGNGGRKGGERLRPERACAKGGRNGGRGGGGQPGEERPERRGEVEEGGRRDEGDSAGDWDGGD